MYEILVIVALNVPANLEHSEEIRRPATETQTLGVDYQYNDSLACQKVALTLIAQPLQKTHMGYFCDVVKKVDSKKPVNKDKK